LAIGLADGGIVLWNLDWVADELKAAGLWGPQPLWYRPLEPSQRPTVAARQQQWDLVDRELVGRKRIEQLLKQWAVPDLDAASFDQNSYVAPLVLEQIREAQGAITETEAITLRLPIEQLKSLSSELRLSGYHIDSLHPYRTAGNVYFAALWKRLKQSTEFRLDLTESELHRTIDSMKRSGYIVCDFGGYLAGHPELSLRHFAIFEPAEQGQLQSRTIQIEAASDLNNKAANAGPTDKQVFTSHLCFDLLDRPYRCTVFESVESAGQPRVVETLSENEFHEQANRFAQQRVYRLNATRDRVTGRLVFHVVTGATGSSNLRPLLCHEPIDLSRDVVRRMMQVGYRPTQLAVTDDGHATIFFDLPGTSSSRQEGTQGNWTDI